jgi:hypothetical protein
MGDLPRAREYNMQAIAIDPRNPVALSKNLGVVLGKEEDSQRALYYLRCSFGIAPQDTENVHEQAFACIWLDQRRSSGLVNINILNYLYKELHFYQ